MRKKKIVIAGMLLVTCMAAVGCQQKSDKQESLAGTPAFETTSEAETETGIQEIETQTAEKETETEEETEKETETETQTAENETERTEQLRHPYSGAAPTTII